MSRRIAFPHPGDVLFGTCSPAWVFVLYLHRVSRALRNIHKTRVRVLYPTDSFTEPEPNSLSSRMESIFPIIGPCSEGRDDLRSFAPLRLRRIREGNSVPQPMPSGTFIRSAAPRRGKHRTQAYSGSGNAGRLRGCTSPASSRPGSISVRNYQQVSVHDEMPGINGSALPCGSEGGGGFVVSESKETAIRQATFSTTHTQTTGRPSPFFSFPHGGLRIPATAGIDPRRHKRISAAPLLRIHTGCGVNLSPNQAFSSYPAGSVPFFSVPATINGMPDGKECPLYPEAEGGGAGRSGRHPVPEIRPAAGPFAAGDNLFGCRKRRNVRGESPGILRTIGTRFDEILRSESKTRGLHCK